MPTDLPEPPKPNPIAVAIGKGATKLAEYLLTAAMFMGICACIALAVMFALAQMHEQEPAVPPFGFMFLWGAIWGSAVLALFAGALVKLALREED